MGLDDSNNTDDADNALVVITDSATGIRASVETDTDGKHKLLTKQTTTVNVNELLGDIVNPFTYFQVTASPLNSTFTVIISADSINVITNITATEADELDLAAALIVDTLNADGTFNALYIAFKPEGSPRVFVHTIDERAGEYNERPSAGAFVVNVAGGAARILPSGFDVIVQRTVPLALYFDFADPLRGRMHIVGSVSVAAKSVEDYFSQKGLNGASSDMAVDGSGTPVEFKVNASSNANLIITEIRVSIEDGGIVFSKFMDIPALANGLKLIIKTKGNIATFSPEMKTTNDVVLLFNSGGLDTFIHLNKRFIGTFKPDNPFILKKGSDDYISMRVRDNLTGLVGMEYSVKGYIG